MHTAATGTSWCVPGSKRSVQSVYQNKIKINNKRLPARPDIHETVNQHSPLDHHFHEIIHSRNYIQHVRQQQKNGRSGVEDPGPGPGGDDHLRSQLRRQRDGGDHDGRPVAELRRRGSWRDRDGDGRVVDGAARPRRVRGRRRGRRGRRRWGAGGHVGGHRGGDDNALAPEVDDSTTSARPPARFAPSEGASASVVTERSPSTSVATERPRTRIR